MSRLHGVDVSRYQPDWTPDPSDAFCFVKATEGRTVLNPLYRNQVNLARGAGMVVGHYHYMHRGNAEGQAAYFVKNTDLHRRGQATGTRASLPVVLQPLGLDEHQCQGP
jgi:GH25 family lysozyme M1 (1,4-beta-N-acetylmuramidase)